MTLRLRAISLAAPVAALLVAGTAVPASAAVSINISAVYSDAAPDVVRPFCNADLKLASDYTADLGDLCAAITLLKVHAAGGADTVNLADVTTADFPALRGVTVDLGDDFDADQATGSPVSDSFIGKGTDTANGGAGDDSFDGVGTAVGGLGDDTFIPGREYGTQSIKYASGGPGNDRFLQFTAETGIEGGEGFDTWEADFDESVSAGTYGDGVTMTLGPLGLVVAVAGLTQNAPISGVEHVNVALLRLSGETWQGADFAGSQIIRGLSGNDTITTGAFADRLDGGSGDDTLTGGAGADLLKGDEGNDTIQARDGVADQIDCGAGTDSVVGDAVDVIVNCETLDVPAAPPVVTPPAPPAQVVLVSFAPVTNAVAGPAKVAKGKTGTFTFGSPTAGATFQCSLDNGAWKTCASPYKIKTNKLKAGKHTLLVRALVGGAADATPSKKTFKVRKG